MRSLGELHPLSVFCYFAGVMSVCMLSLHPALIILSLLGCLTLLLLHNQVKARTLAASLGLFTVLMLLNPLFYHDGITVLFVINDRPFTLEALLYGAAAAGMILSMVGWFRLLSRALTNDRLLYLLGRLSPRLALMVSMALRFVPAFARQGQRIHQAQQGLGLYRGDNAPDALRGRIREFSILTTWALENGIVTADSMAARGYGTGRRTSYAIFRFTRVDALFMLFSLALTAVTLTAILSSALKFDYYPALTPPADTLLARAGLCAYSVLCLLPALMEGGERIRWRCLQSRI